MILQKMLFRKVDPSMTLNNILFIFDSLNEHRTFSILISVDWHSTILVTQGLNGATKAIFRAKPSVSKLAA
jgi:hypothetical protein